MLAFVNVRMTRGECSNRWRILLSEGEEQTACGQSDVEDITAHWPAWKT